MAEAVVSELEKERAQHGPLSLGVILNEGDAATQSFVRIKQRVAERLGIEVRAFPPDYYQEAFGCNGVIVQLPLSNAEEILAALPPEKDVDGLSRSPLVRPPVAGAVEAILVSAGVSIAGKRAIVVGQGKLVGAPVAAFLREKAAEVEVVTHGHGSLATLVGADIVVLGAGEPGLVKKEMLKEGVVLIDAGTSESAGKLVGDADPACAEVASVFTPVPGGVGPLAVAMLFKNFFFLVNKNSGR